MLISNEALQTNSLILSLEKCMYANLIFVVFSPIGVLCISTVDLCLVEFSQKATWGKINES